MFACIGFYFGFLILWLLYYTCLYPASPLVFYSIGLLLLSYHTMSLSYLISYAVYLLVLHACAYDTVFMFMIQIYRYTCAYPYSPSGICITARLGSSDSSGSSCPGFGAKSVWILPVADQSSAAVAWIFSRSFRAPSFQAPICLSSFPIANSWVPFYCLLLYISWLSRNCAYQWCNIHVILDHLWW